MSGNVHHEAKALDIIELTGLPTLGDLFEPGCQLHRDALESIFQKSEPDMSQMLSMMKHLLDCPALKKPLTAFVMLVC